MATSEHPSWCAGTAGGCTDSHHRSAELIVPGNDLSGVGAAAALRGGDDGPMFVELRLSHFPERTSQPSEPLFYVALPSERTGATPGEAAAPNLALLEDDSDGVLDFLPHDFTIDQVEQLHAALGQLLAYAGETMALLAEPA